MTKIWITWEKHRRTSELVAAMPGLKLFELESETARQLNSKLERLIDYPNLLLQTIRILVQEHADIVIVQNPSVLLSLFMVTFGKVLAPNVIVDAHNGGVRPFHAKYTWLKPIFSIIHRWAELIIVTNDELAKIIRKNRGRPFILQDKIPSLDAACHIPLKGEFNLVLVCTFEPDEPFQEVIRASGFIDQSICIYITGKYQKANQTIINQASSNVIFTGFLPENEYISLLNSCDIVIDLTLEPDCLVCGAYEAVALGKPLILTDMPALRNYFKHGAVYTKNRAEEIAESIQYAIRHKERLKKGINILKSALEKAWSEKLDELLFIMDQMGKSPDLNRFSEMDQKFIPSEADRMKS